ncbi:MAG: hypothetical protein ACM3JI_05810 [Anaerolineae bacterium]
MSFSSIMSTLSSGPVKVNLGFGQAVRSMRQSARGTGYVSYVMKKLNEIEEDGKNNGHKVDKAYEYITKEKENILNEMKTHPDRLKNLEEVVNNLNNSDVLPLTVGMEAGNKFEKIQSFVKEAHAQVFPEDLRLEEKRKESEQLLADRQKYLANLRNLKEKEDGSINNE